MPRLNELYPNLPGHFTEFKDGGFTVRTDANPPETGSLLILGTAVDGPVLEPIAVDGATASYVFGTDVNSNGFSNGSTLIPAFKQAWDAGCRDIRLMRVTGKPAQTVLNGASVASSTPIKYSETLGSVLGNDETTLILAHAPLSSTTQVVIQNVSLIPANFTVTDTTLTIKANVANAGKSIQVSYDYTGSIENTESVVVSGTTTKTATISKVVTAVKSVKYGGDTLTLTTDYTVSGSVITLVGNIKTNNILAGQSLEVSYTYSGTLHAVETGSTAAPFVTEKSIQNLTLSKTPTVSSVHVYTNGEEMLNPDAFTVDYTGKKVGLHKEYFVKDSTISVSYLYTDGTSVTNTVRLEAYNGGIKYNECSFEVKQKTNTEGIETGKEVILTKPANSSGVIEDSLVYSSADYPTFLSLVNAINSDPNNKVIKASTDFDGARTADLEVTSGKFSQGSDEVNITKQELFNALSGIRNEDGSLSQIGAYQILEDYQVDAVVLSGVYADDDNELSGNFQNFAYELALFCAVLSYRNRTTFGYIAMKPNRNTSILGIKTYANKLATYNNNYIMRDYNGKPLMDADGNYIDLGKYISVVGGPDPIVNDRTIGLYNGNPAVLYAAMNSVIPANSSPTNKKLPGCRGLRFRFSNSQINDITANRIVTLKVKTDKTGTISDVYVVDGITAALKGSAYQRITTPKTLKEVVDNIREVADPYIGESNTVEQKNALASSVSKRLGLLKERGFIQDYSFQIVANALDQILGQAKIELTIVPPQELRKITTVVSLKPTL